MMQPRMVVSRTRLDVPNHWRMVWRGRVHGDMRMAFPLWDES